MNVTDLVLNDSARLAVSHHGISGAPTVRTYRSISRNVEALGAGLAQLGITAGTRVLIVASTGIEMLELLIATMRVGATVVPMSPLVGAATLVSVIGTMRPSCCIFDDALPSQVADALRDSCCTFISLKGKAGSVQPSYRSLLGTSPDSRARADVPGSQPAVVVFSSGSEGTPKGIRLTHDELGTFLELNSYMHSQYAEEAESGYPQSPFICVIPINHLAGVGMCLNGLTYDRPTYLLSHFLPQLYLRLVEESRSTVLMLVPSMFRKLLADPALRTTDLSAVRYCIPMGEPCSPELSAEIAQAFGATVATAYGMTECFSGIGHSKADLLRGHAPHGSCGRHLFGEVKLVDRNGADSTTGFGELRVRNKSVRECYTDPALNAARFHDGWYATKDLFERDASGSYYHRGRADDMFVCNGRNLYPVEIETVLARHPAIVQVCAAPIESRERKTLPAVLIQARQSLRAEEVIDFAAVNGPSHAVPRVVSFAERFPETGPGKVNRIAVQKLLQAAYDGAELSRGRAALASAGS